MVESLEQKALRIWTALDKDYRGLGHRPMWIVEFASRLLAETAEPVAWVEHNKGGDNLVWEQSNLPCSPLFASPANAELAKLRQEREGMVLVPRERLQHWLEYWNGNRNETAMANALQYILEDINEVLAAAKEQP